MDNETQSIISIILSTVIIIGFFLLVYYVRGILMILKKNFPDYNPADEAAKAFQRSFQRFKLMEFQGDKAGQLQSLNESLFYLRQYLPDTKSEVDTKIQRMSDVENKIKSLQA